MSESSWILTTTIPSPVVTTTSPFGALPNSEGVYATALRRIRAGETAAYPARVVLGLPYIGRHRVDDSR